MSKLILNRRSFINTAAATATLIASPAYIRRASAATNELNIWTYDKFLPESFVTQFQNETGITVNIRLVDEQGTEFNLMAAEAPNLTADIVTVAGHRYLQFIDAELIAPFDSQRLKNWSNINPIFSESDWATVRGEKWGVPILSGSEILAYNTDLVSADDARSWDVMFADQYAKQTSYILLDFLSVVMLYMGYDGNLIEYADDPEKAAAIVAEARDFLIEKKPLVRKYYDSGAEVQQMFINQDIALAHGWNGPIATLIADGAPVAMTIPREGSYGFVFTLNLANGARNADNAYQFLDAMLASPEVGAEMTRGSGYISTYKDASTYLTEIERKSTSFSEEELSSLQFFRAEANEMKYDLLDPAVQVIKSA